MYGAVKGVATTFWSGVTAARHGDIKGMFRAGTKNGLFFLSTYAGAKIDVPGLRGFKGGLKDVPGRPPVEDPVSPAAPSKIRIGCNSFAPNTPVLLADGNTKSIKDIRVGDILVATDTATGMTGDEAVTTLHHNNDTELTNLTVTDHAGHRATIRTTPQPLVLGCHH